jgi:hypothetical protein
MIKSSKLLKLTLSKNKNLFWGVIISLIIHLFLLTKPLFKLPVLDKGKQTFNVSLVNQQAIQESTSGANVKRLQNTVIKMPNHKPARIKPEAAVNHTAIPETTLLPLETNKSVEFTDAAIIALNHLPQPYHYIETDFEIYLDNTANAATTKIVFIINENNTYSLTSITQTNRLASLYLDSLIQKSEIVSQGIVFENGLRPNNYSYLYGNNIRNANFAWSDGLLEMNSEQGKKTETILVGTQDFLSYMYQFMFISPLKNTQITMTNGENLHTYHYSSQGEETITTKLGELNTIHMIESENDVEKTELWLAIDYQYVPVKIRKTEKNGSLIEQIASKISTVPP